MLSAQHSLDRKLYLFARFAGDLWRKARLGWRGLAAAQTLTDAGIATLVYS